MLRWSYRWEGIELMSSFRTFTLALLVACGACHSPEPSGSALTGSEFVNIGAVNDPEQRAALSAYAKKSADSTEEKPAQKAEVRDDSDCPSGCSLKSHDVAPFTVEQYREALSAYAAGPVNSESDSLDTLLFYGERTRELITRYGAGPLSKDHLEFLRRELTRSHALVAIRIVDAAGRVRANLPWKRVPFGHKQHLHPKTVDIQEMSFNGSVMRTGLGHIWARY